MWYRSCIYLLYADFGMWFRVRKIWLQPQNEYFTKQAFSGLGCLFMLGGAMILNTVQVTVFCFPSWSPLCGVWNNVLESFHWVLNNPCWFFFSFFFFPPPIFYNLKIVSSYSWLFGFVSLFWGEVVNEECARSSSKTWSSWHWSLNKQNNTTW